jgi:phosphoglycolate phosphatase-like HAD superfamily hydrolase
MKLFIWDFHGTLEIGNDSIVVEITNAVLTSFGYRQRLTDEQSIEYSGSKWCEYFAKLLPHESNDTHMKLQEASFLYANAHPELITKFIKPASHALLVLEAIQKNHDQILISSTKSALLALYLDTVNMNHIFPKGKAFATTTSTQTRTKLDIAREYLADKQFDQIIVIGDSPKDIEFGRELHATTILYTHTGRAFRTCNPTFKTNDLQHILSFVQL